MSDIRYEGGFPVPPPVTGEVRVVATDEGREGYWVQVGREASGRGRRAAGPYAKGMWFSAEEYAALQALTPRGAPGKGKALSSKDRTRKPTEKQRLTAAAQKAAAG